MLTGESDDPRETPTQAHHGRTASRDKRLKLVAAIAGVLGSLLALSVPFLPVNYDITTLKWPTAEGTKPVSAPLVAYSPLSVDLVVPCSAARELDERKPEPAVVLSTNPPQSEYGNLTELSLQVRDGNAVLTSRGQQLGEAPITEGNCTITVRSDGYATVGSIDDRKFASVNADVRPQMTGIYSDFQNGVDDVRGVSFEAQVDDRYQSTVTPIKLAAIVLAVICFLCCLVAMRGFDARAARRYRKLAPPGWWKPTSVDLAVLAALVLCWLIGAMTADDGYFLTMARVREDLGYVSDFYRWFAVAVAPMGWFVDVYAWWVQFSTATPWVRLPSLAMGVVSWLLISREVLPRLGQQVRRSHAAGWAAAAVFLAFWLPYNNGLRPEPIVVVFSLLALCAVERSVATKRMVPAALGLVCAALAVAANPHGMVAAVPFVAAFKPLSRLVAQRAREFGWLPVIAPIASTGLVILTLAFSDQTWQSVMDATDSRKAIGPDQTWYEEIHRYSLLFSPIPDGALTRRFPVLLVVLCLLTCFAVLLRRGKIRGAALGPSRRLLGVAALSFVALALTPTKHTHHFGVLAAVGGPLAALTALAVSTTVLRSRRNRAIFFAGLMLILAYSATGTNAWWYVSGWGVPWFDKPPSIQGYQASTFLLIIAGIALVVALVEHLRIDEHNPKVVDQSSEPRGNALRLGTAPLSLVCALLIVGEIATFAKVIQEQWGSYSLGQDNVKQLVGSSCGLSDYVYVETDPLAGVLPVSAQQPTTAVPGMKVPKNNGTRERPEDYLRVKTQGFQRDGLPSVDSTDPNAPDWTPPNHFGGDRAPVWGSYEQTGTGTGELLTDWYDLPQRAIDGEVPVVLTVAGIEGQPNSVSIEFGRDTDEGFEILQRYPVVQGPAPEWRDHRVTVGGASEGATKMRVVAEDNGLGPDGWVAVSAPRAPQLTKMTDVIGNAPTYVEWPAAFVHPCLDITTNRSGIAEIPRFRVAAGGEVRAIGQGWASPDAGGAFGWMSVATSMRELPTYLKNDITRDWGSLYLVDRYVPDALPARAAMSVRTETHWGTWSPGPLSATIQLPGDVPNSDDRTDIPLDTSDDADNGS